MENAYTITLSDGRIISGLTMNGNNYISDTEVLSEWFDDNCFNVQISDGTTIETHPFMELVQIMPYNGEYYFILRDLTEAELKEKQLWATIDYLSMMVEE